ncbi:MAG: TIGR00725 family protein [Candidatus Caldatribacteriaceae bacterium]
MRSSLYIGVIGQGVCDDRLYQLACQVGKEIARRGAILICGGLGGVMEAACRGAKEAGGITVGILPGFSREDANPFVDVAIVTGLGEARNLIIVHTASGLVACGGQAGTLSEIAFALRAGKPLAGLETWKIQDNQGKGDFFPHFATPEEAVTFIFQCLRR